MRIQPLAAILLAAAAGAFAGCHRHSPEQQKIAMQLPQGTPMHPHGIPALKVKPGPQPFTQADVAAFFATHSFLLDQPDPNQIHVSNLEFITAAQARDRLQGESTGLDDSATVGFVTLTGTFTFSGPMATKTATFSSAYAIFSASTGALIMDGSLEPGKGGGANTR
ncbi:MAG TPA: hypothetical protein VME23_17695 [Terracidiphilus sp.]|jgi:hypothetical protein|nr:hypothetical protein [Terracidiphilus sp.]